MAPSLPGRGVSRRGRLHFPVDVFKWYLTRNYWQVRSGHLLTRSVATNTLDLSHYHRYGPLLVGSVRLASLFSLSQSAKGPFRFAHVDLSFVFRLSSLLSNLSCGPRIFCFQCSHARKEHKRGSMPLSRPGPGADPTINLLSQERSSRPILRNPEPRPQLQDAVQ